MARARFASFAFLACGSAAAWPGVRLPPLTTDDTLSQSRHKIAVGDFNGDGLRDAVFATPVYDASKPESVVVMLRTSDGWLGTFLPHPAGADAVVGADMDGDGRDDIAVMGSGWSGIRLYFQNAAGEFESPIHLDTGNTAGDVHTSGILFADTDRDGFGELLLFREFFGDGLGDGMSVGVVNGLENRTPVLSYGRPGFYINDGAGKRTLVDVDGDGDLDLLEELGAWVFQSINDGGTFGPAIQRSDDRAETFFVDADGDGVPDIVRIGDDLVATELLGVNPPVTIERAMPQPIHTELRAVGDVTGDGRGDLIATYFSAWMLVTDLIGTPRIASSGLIRTQDYFRDTFDSVDLDGDGSLELVTNAFEQASVYEVDTSSPNPLRTSCIDIEFGSSPRIADLNGDGVDDVLFGSPGAFMIRSPDGQPTAPIEVSDGGRYPVVGDWDGDGLIDAAWVTDSWTVPIYLNSVAGIDPDAPLIFVDPDDRKDYSAGMAVDLDGDGDDELIMSDTRFGTLLVIAADGQAGVSVLQQAGFGTADIRSFEPLDWNQDGHTDVAAVTERGSILVFENDGTGTLLDAHEVINTDSDFREAAMASGDFDRDGFDDLVLSRTVYNSDRDSLRIYWGEPAGFSEPDPYRIGKQLTQVLAADPDGDGALDVVFYDLGYLHSAGSVWIGTWSESRELTAVELENRSTGSVALGDWNLDGAKDIWISNLSAWQSGCDLRVLFGTPSSCPADLAAPFGALNVFDLIEYIALYNTQDPAADLAAPAGSFNIFDVQAYLGLYHAGCR